MQTFRLYSSAFRKTYFWTPLQCWFERQKEVSFHDYTCWIRVDGLLRSYRGPYGPGVRFLSGWIGLRRDPVDVKVDFSPVGVSLFDIRSHRRFYGGGGQYLYFGDGWRGFFGEVHC